MSNISSGSSQGSPSPPSAKSFLIPNITLYAP